MSFHVRQEPAIVVKCCYCIKKMCSLDEPKAINEESDHTFCSQCYSNHDKLYCNRTVIAKDEQESAKLVTAAKGLKRKRTSVKEYATSKLAFDLVFVEYFADQGKPTRSKRQRISHGFICGWCSKPLLLEKSRVRMCKPCGFLCKNCYDVHEGTPKTYDHQITGFNNNQAFARQLLNYAESKNWKYEKIDRGTEVIPEEMVFTSEEVDEMRATTLQNHPNNSTNASVRASNQIALSQATFSRTTSSEAIAEPELTLSPPLSQAIDNSPYLDVLPPMIIPNVLVEVSAADNFPQLNALPPMVIPNVAVEVTADVISEHTDVMKPMI